MIYPSDAKKLADVILFTVANTCTQLSIPYFLTQGTLLGLYRDGEYILYDSDLDIAVVPTINLSEIISALHQEGIVVEGWGQWENRHFWKDGILLDITWVKSVGFYADYDILQYDDYDYHIPYPIEDYLEWKYGTTWQTPLKKGQYTFQHEE